MFNQSIDTLKRLVIVWKPKIFFDESIKSPATSCDSFDPSLNYIGVRTTIKFDGQCLKQVKVTFTHKNIVNIFIVYEINLLQYTQSCCHVMYLGLLR